MKIYSAAFLVLGITIGITAKVNASPDLSTSQVHKNNLASDLASDLKGQGFTSQDIDTVTREINFQELSDKELSWVLKNVGPVLRSLKKINVSSQDGNLGRALILKGIGETISSKNLEVAKNILTTLDDQYQKNPVKFNCWNDLRFHLLTVSMALKGQKQDNIISFVSQASMKKVSPKKMFLKTKKLPTLSSSLNEDHITKDVDKNDRGQEADFFNSRPSHGLFKFLRSDAKR